MAPKKCPEVHTCIPKVRELASKITALQSEFLGSKSLESRKILGQFFTGVNVAFYMASLANDPKKRKIRILDAGAGTGILAIATSLRCIEFDCEEVEVDLYELDREVVPYLNEVMNIAKSAFIDAGKKIKFNVLLSDFVLERPDKRPRRKGFDLCVINPPYFKYSVKDSPYSKVALDLYRGDPNIYASFLAIAMSSLADHGQMVSITPRSFTNGLYFKGFRQYILSESALDKIHIFKHRNKIFKNSESAVLQENIICHFTKGEQTRNIAVYSSDCDAEIESAEVAEYPTDLVIDPSNDQKIIRIPETKKEAGILRHAESFANTFEGAGYFISTGRVVEHRTRHFITSEPTSGAVPLYRPHNVTPLKAAWTGDHKKDVSFILKEDHEKHTMKNGNYVLLKRFSSKDEKRRLVASVHVGTDHGCEFIGFGNKTNYIGVKGEDLTEVEAFGLSTIFNSSFMDSYFRCISGNTQVNATEIRVMKFPSRDQVAEIGKNAIHLSEAKTDSIDEIVNPLLGVVR